MDILVVAGLGFTALVALIVAVFSILKAKKNNIKISELEAGVEAYSKKISVLSDSMMGLGKNVVQLQDELRELQTIAVAEPLEDPQEDSILQAAAMLDNGVSAADVAKQCGIPEHEAQLMQAVRKSRSVTLNPEVSVGDQ